MTTPGGQRLTDSINAHKQRLGCAVVPYVTAGFPTKDRFLPTLRAIAPHSAVIEVGVPFSDPMADGATIQRSSHVALTNGVSLAWILEQLPQANIATPVVLMSYLNPLLALGLSGLATRASAAGVSGMIIPDLPMEECASVKAALNGAGVGLVQMVTPVTPPERLAKLAQVSDGFVYAVTITGVTGASAAVGDIGAYLARIKSVSPVPVCAGFGIRTRADVQKLAGQSDGAIVGSALIEVLERGEDPAKFIAGLGG